MDSFARIDLGPVYQLVAVKNGCRQHVGFHAKSDDEAIIESAFLRAFHSVRAYDPQCRDCWLTGDLTLTCGDRVVTTSIPIADLKDPQ